MFGVFQNKKVVIYGIGRFQMDFQCIFDTIEVAYYVSEDTSEQKMFEKEVRNPEYLKEEKDENLLVIVCDLDFDTKKQELIAYGLAEKQIIYGEDLFPLLDNYQCDIEKEEVVMWGVGNTTKEFFERYDRIWQTEPNITYFIDKDPGQEGSLFLERPVKCVENLTAEEWKNHFIIIGTVFYEDVKKELCAKGLKEFEDFVYWSYALAKPSKMMSKIIRTESKKYNTCRMPFGTFWEININGVYGCSTTWATKMPMGDIVVQSLDEIWNGTIAKIFRLTLMNHTFCFCDMNKCPLANIGIERKEYYTAKDIMPSEVPTVTQIAIDDTCNLYCRMCRDHVRGANEAHRKIRMKAAEEIIMSKYLNQSERLIVAGAGEVFASQVYDKILFGNPDIKRKSITLMTNLMLFNKEKWEKLKQYYEDISFEISVDGADKETFEYIRRGAKYERLLENLEFLSKLRAKGEVSKVSFITVVQKSNYTQVIPILQMIEKYGFDKMILCKILNWNMYSEEYFYENIAMCEKDGNTFKPEFIRIVEQDEFKRLISKIEFTGNMAEIYYKVYLPNKEKNIC